MWKSPATLIVVQMVAHQKCYWHKRLKAPKTELGCAQQVFPSVFSQEKWKHRLFEWEADANRGVVLNNSWDKKREAVLELSTWSICLQVLQNGRVRRGLHSYIALNICVAVFTLQ